MSEVPALPPGRGPRTRLWDDDLNCVFDSATDDRTVEQFLADQVELNYTVDHPPQFDWRTRRSGKVARGDDGELRWWESRELLKYLKWPTNPYRAKPTCCEGGPQWGHDWNCPTLP